MGLLLDNVVEMAKRVASPGLCYLNKGVKMNYNTSYSSKFGKTYDWMKKNDRGALQAY